MTSTLVKRVLLFALSIVPVFGSFGETSPSGPHGPSGDQLARLAHPNPSVRLSAIEAVGSLGPESVEALPQLLELLDGGAKSDQVNAAWALGKIAPTDPRAIQALLRALDRGDPDLAYNAALSIGWAGDAARPNLEETFNHAESPWGRYYAGFYLAALEASYHERIGASYRELIEGNDTALTIAALHGISFLSALHPPTIATIRQCLQSEAPAVREAAARCVEPYGVSAAALKSDLMRLIQTDDNRDAKLAAITSLAAITRDGDALELVARLLYDDDRRIRQWAIDNAYRFGPAAIAPLKQVLSSGKREAQLAALDAIALIDAEDPAFVDELLQSYEDSDWETQFRMLYCLWSLGKDRADIAEFLVDKKENDPNPTIRAHARSIVAQLESGRN